MWHPLKRSVFFFLILLTPTWVNGQEYRMEVGAMGGISSYMGDINAYNPFLRVGPGYGLFFRTNIDRRWVVKVNAYRAGLEGNSSDLGLVFPEGKSYSFQKDVWDFGVQIEHNFFRYGMPSFELSKRFSPYILFGVGATLVPGSGGKDIWAVNMPIGLGFKYKVARRWNLGLEWSFRKTFTDNMDNVDDPYGAESLFFKNTDWYMMAMFFVSFDFMNAKCIPCNK